MRRFKKFLYRGKMREPYMGNQVEVKVEITITEKGRMIVKLLSPEGIETRCSIIEQEEEKNG